MFSANAIAKFSASTIALTHFNRAHQIKPAQLANNLAIFFDKFILQE